MLKLNDSQEFTDGNVHIINFSNSGLEKIAACDEITKFVSTIKPVPGRSYIHCNILGSSETWGNTKNGDYFSADTLRKYHKTFADGGKLFRHHQNKSTSPHFGKVLFATFNENMQRVEVVVEVDEVTSKEVDDLMSKGIYPKTSMAVRLPRDRCSICNNKAATRQEYCKHLMFEMNKIYPDGRKVYAINEDNLKFFDVSMVIRPADPTSSFLSKVASDEYIGTIGSAELAELAGYTEKVSKVMKWSEIVKEISESGEVLQNANTSRILNSTRDLPLSLIPVLSQYDLNQSLTTMAILGISPSIGFLAELIAKIHLGEGYGGIGDLVEEYLKSVPEDTLTSAINIESPITPVSPILLSALVPYIEGSSLLSSAIEKRASGVGYAHLGPHVEPTYQEELAAAAALQPQVKNFELSYGKLLLGLGASALLAKYFISSEIEKRLREERNMHIPENYAKIKLIKKADYTAASSLSRASITPYTLQKQREDDGSMHGLNMARKLLKSTKTVVGGKLASMLKIVGLGQKVKETLIQ